MNYEPRESEFAGDNDWMIPVPKRPMRKWKVLLSLGIVVGLVASVLTLVLVRNSGHPELNLSSETLELIGKAADVCSNESNAYPSNCGPAVWKACYAAQRETETPKAFERKSYVNKTRTANFLCFTAVLAEAGELSLALAYRYGNQYYPYQFGWSGKYHPDGWQYTPEEIYPFYLFHESVIYWNSHFAEAFSTLPDGLILDPIIPWLSVRRNYKRKPVSNGPLSDAAIAVLRPLREAVSNILREYGYRSSDSPLPPFTLQPTLTSTSVVELPMLQSETAQICHDSIASARLGTPEWQSDIQRCLISAEMCAEHTQAEVSLREECSRLSLAADFESRWQQLPHVCITAGKETDLDSPNDPCRKAAEELCWHTHRQYQGFSLPEIPDNPAEDFTCAAARATPYTT